MKYLLIIMFVVLSVKAETQLDLLIPGLSHHTAEPTYVDEFNEVNYGLGVRYRIQNTNYEYDFSTMVLKDSYSHLMATATYGVNYYLFKNEDLNVRVGGNIGLGYRKMLYVYDTYSYFEYNIVPLISPSLSIEYKSIGINFTYVPKINTTIQDYVLEVREVYFMYFNIKLG